MASMVQLCAPNEHFEGSASSAAFSLSSQLAFDSCAPPNLFVNTAGGANTITWAQPCTKSCCIPRPMEGPVLTPGPLINSAHADPADDHDFSFMDAIAKNISYLDLLSFNTSHISADLDMDLPLQEEMQLGLHRNLSVYGGVNYGDKSLSTEASGMAAEAADDRISESLMQACSNGDDVKLSNLARSLTFPPATRACSSSSSGAARSPLLLTGSDGQINHMINHGRYFNNRNTCREISCNSAATTSCSAEQPDGQREAKIKAEASEMTHCQDQQERFQHMGPTKGSKQSKKRVAIASTCLNNAKAPRVDTPSDVVHVRARRGQATDSHSLAERVRREKISQRMKVLQEIVPGCHKVLGKAMMLDEIINYVKSLQRQIEFLSMKLAAANQAGMASMITEKVNFLSSNVGILGDLHSSQIQLMQIEPLITSLMQ